MRRSADARRQEQMQVTRIVRAAQVDQETFTAGAHKIELRAVHGPRKWHPVVIDGRIVVLSSGQQYNLFELLLRAAVADPPVVLSLTAMLRAAMLLGEQVAFEDLDPRTQEGLRIALRRPLYRLRRKLEMATIEVGSVTTANGVAVGYLFLFYDIGSGNSPIPYTAEGLEIPALNPSPFAAAEHPSLSRSDAPDGGEAGEDRRDQRVPPALREPGMANVALADRFTA